MNLGAYSGLLVPAVVALILLIMVIKVVNAVLRLISLVLLVAVIAGGYLLFGRVSALQKAVDAAAGQNTSGLTTANAIYNAVSTPARQALSSVGLDPGLLRVRILCAGPNTRIQLRYNDQGFLFGMLDQYYDVPHNSRVGC